MVVITKWLRFFSETLKTYSPIDLCTTSTNQGPYFLKLYIVYFITASSTLTPKQFNNLYYRIFIMI